METISERQIRITNGDEPYIVVNWDKSWPIPFKMVKGHIVFTDIEEMGKSVEDVLLDYVLVDHYRLSHHCYTANGTLKKQYAPAIRELDAAAAKIKQAIIDGAINDGEACPKCRKFWKVNDWHFCPWCGKTIPIY